MNLRLTLPSTLVMTLVCSCHSDGQHPTDATVRADARVSDAPALIDAALVDAPVDGAMLADAAVQPDAPALPDAATQPDAVAQPDAAVMADATIDAIPDADLA